MVEALVDMGARRAAIQASGVGETDLAVQTDDGVKEAKNRRAVIGSATLVIPVAVSDRDTLATGLATRWPDICAGLHGSATAEGGYFDAATNRLSCAL